MENEVEMVNIFWVLFPTEVSFLSLSFLAGKTKWPCMHHITPLIGSAGTPALVSGSLLGSLRPIKFSLLRECPAHQVRTQSVLTKLDANQIE